MQVNRFRRECGRHRATLMAPSRALTEEESLSQDRPQNPDRGRGATVVLIIVDENMTDSVRLVQDEDEAEGATGVRCIRSSPEWSPGADMSSCRSV